MAVITVLAAIVSVDIMKVSSNSMEPALRDGDMVLVANVAPLFKCSLLARWARPPRGKIVILRGPQSGAPLLVKRVIATEGDRVRIDQGEVRLNGATHKEPYRVVNTSEDWPRKTSTERGEGITVPARHYFVLGDNRIASYDSRHWGSVPEAQIIAFMVAVLPSSHKSGATPDSK
jgi:signal peptidase I